LPHRQEDNVFYFREWLLLAIAMFFATAVDLAAAVEFSVNGDVRTSFFSLHREDRDGRESSTHEFRVRPRAGIGAKLNEQWRMQVRFAGRYSTDGSKFYFEIFDSIPIERCPAYIRHEQQLGLFQYITGMQIARHGPPCLICLEGRACRLVTGVKP
jgi:hypothetical protein